MASPITLEPTTARASFAVYAFRELMSEPMPGRIKAAAARARAKDPDIAGHDSFIIGCTCRACKGTYDEMINMQEDRIKEATEAAWAENPECTDIWQAIAKQLAITAANIGPIEKDVCPICKGRCIVPKEPFVSKPTCWCKCHACDGTGIVWPPQDRSFPEMATTIDTTHRVTMASASHIKIGEHMFDWLWGRVSERESQENWWALNRVTSQKVLEAMDLVGSTLCVASRCGYAHLNTHDKTSFWYHLWLRYGGEKIVVSLIPKATVERDADLSSELFGKEPGSLAQGWVTKAQWDEYLRKPRGIWPDQAANKVSARRKQCRPFLKPERRPWFITSTWWMIAVVFALWWFTLGFASHGLIAEQAQ